MSRATQALRVMMQVRTLYRPALPNAPARDSPKRDSTYYGVQDRRVPPKGWEISDVGAAHPLWQFFHNKDPLPAPDARTQHGGRAWLEEELRRKSFEDLHQLWWILIKERGALLTQRHEAQRLHVQLNTTFIRERLRKVARSMARIKAIVNERRIALKQAHEILQTEDLVNRYPGLARFDEHAQSVLRPQQWRSLGAAQHQKVEASSEPPAAADGSWEYLAPEKTPKRVDRTPPTATAFLQRAIRNRLAAQAKVEGRKTVQRNMTRQAARITAVLKQRSPDTPLPPLLAKYAGIELSDPTSSASSTTAPAPAPRRPTQTQRLLAEVSAGQRSEQQRVHGP